MNQLETEINAEITAILEPKPTGFAISLSAKTTWWQVKVMPGAVGIYDFYPRSNFFDKVSDAVALLSLFKVIKLERTSQDWYQLTYRDSNGDEKIAPEAPDFARAIVVAFLEKSGRLYFNYIKPPKGQESQTYGFQINKPS